MRRPKKAPQSILTIFRSCSTARGATFVALALPPPEPPSHSIEVAPGRPRPPRVISPERFASEWIHGVLRVETARLPCARPLPLGPLSLSPAQAVGADGLQRDPQSRARRRRR